MSIYKYIIIYIIISYIKNMCNIFNTLLCVNFVIVRELLYD